MEEHLKGIPRNMVIKGVGAFAKIITTCLNNTTVHNSETLLHLVRSRPPGTPLITVSNHMSTLDDPLMWGFKGFPIGDARLARWIGLGFSPNKNHAPEAIEFVMNAENLHCTGKCIPITRGGGIYQEHMNEAIDRLREGGWVYPYYLVTLCCLNLENYVVQGYPKPPLQLPLVWKKRGRIALHTFPEGKVSQEGVPIRRLKWGTASLIERAPLTPIVLPIVHCGFEKVMPEKYFFDRRPPLPLIGKDIRIIVGEPIEFGLPELRHTAIAMSRELPLCSLGWPTRSPHGLDEAAQRWLYTNISDRIWSVMEGLRVSNF
ncbi:hypothetical protein IFM89_031828 [Coptis chinensis]|uniref:Tafazzin family protein n=1 Tax=Coptis chinensis TaxID=261450 RepID=A0A835HR24_9MAGN|nr:hypothetical protein IFM89_031828 [Coptis chinensis]